MYKYYLFTHNDLDGAGCSILFQLFYNGAIKGDEYNVTTSSIQELPANIYDELNSQAIVPNYTELYFADICPPKETMIHLQELGFKINVFDHHISNAWVNDLGLNVVKLIYTTELGEKECGTSLLYKYLCEVAETEPGHEYLNEKMNIQLLPEFVELVRLYDTYQWKRFNKIESRYLQILLIMLGMDKFCERYINKFKNPDETSLVSDTEMDFINAKLEHEEKVINNFTPQKVTTLNCRGRNIALIIGPPGANFSELSSIFLKRYPEYDAVVEFYLGSDGGTFQIRGKGDLNLAEEIAIPIGGGGHPSACGASLPDEYKSQLKQLIQHALVEYHV